MFGLSTELIHQCKLATVVIQVKRPIYVHLSTLLINQTSIVFRSGSIVVRSFVLSPLVLIRNHSFPCGRDRILTWMCVPTISSS